MECECRCASLLSNASLQIPMQWTQLRNVPYAASTPLPSASLPSPTLAYDLVTTALIAALDVSQLVHCDSMRNGFLMRGVQMSSNSPSLTASALDGRSHHWIAASSSAQRLRKCCSRSSMVVVARWMLVPLPPATTKGPRIMVTVD